MVLWRTWTVAMSLYPHYLTVFLSTIEDLPAVKGVDSQVRYSIMADQWSCLLMKRADAACLQLSMMALSSAFLFSGWWSLANTDMGDEFLSPPCNDKHFNHIYPVFIHQSHSEISNCTQPLKTLPKNHICSFMNYNSTENTIYTYKPHHYSWLFFYSKSYSRKCWSKKTKYTSVYIKAMEW